MSVAGLCRWSAIAMAIVAVVDPQVPLPHRTRPAVRVLAGDDRQAAADLHQRLGAAGFASQADGEVATVATPSVTLETLPSTPLFAIDPAAAGTTIERAQTVGGRAPGQAVPIAVTVRGRHTAGTSTTIRLEDGGLTVATATHRWTNEDEHWQAAMTYLPAEPGAVRLRVRIDGAAGEGSVADVFAAPQRGPIRTLVFAPAVTWPAVFVRRTLETDVAFSVASLQRATKSAVTNAGRAPATLTRQDLEPYDVLLSSTLDLDSSSRDSVRWFVEERGGVAVFVPDDVPQHADAVLPGLAFQSRVVDTPVALTAGHGGLAASELAVPRDLPSMTTALASDGSGTAMVFSARRGLGAVIVSGALDAWRYRDARFDEFWRTAILADAIAAPPRLAVSLNPSIARPGDRVRVTARVRPTELPSGGTEVVLPPASARAIARSTSIDQPVRLWPTPEPGVYEGEWTAAASGDYAIDVSIGTLSAAAVMTVNDDAARRAVSDATLRTAARVTGGDVFGDMTAAVAALASRFPASTTWSAGHPARSLWWAVAFALLLCAEWALRRRRGLA